MLTRFISHWVRPCCRRKKTLKTNGIWYVTWQGEFHIFQLVYFQRCCWSIKSMSRPMISVTNNIRPKIEILLPLCMISKNSFMCCILAFDPAKNAIPRWCTGRRWHILMAVMRGYRVGGNWLTKWNEVKKFRWYTLRLMHRKRVTCELHDSYIRLITSKHAISKIE